MVDNRVTFGSKLGVILATVGCAVGLGSIWRFPYMLGTNGGAAFLLIYILFMIFLGIPVMVTEFFIGRYSRSNTVGSFKKMAPGTKWCWIGYNGILAAPGLLCGRFRLDTRIRLADSKRQPLQYAGGGLYRRLRQLLFQCTPADLLDSGLYRTDAFRDCLRCGERYRTGLQDHDATPVLYPGRDVCTLRHAAKCRSGTGVPVQTGFQQADFIRCTECRRAGVLFAESRHGLPYHLLFLFRE